MALPPDRPSPRHGQEAALLAVVFLLALAVRAYVLWVMRDSPFLRTPIADAREYHFWACSIASGEGLLRRMASHSPLYPLGLAAWYRAFGANLWAVYIGQAVLGALTALLCARTAWNTTRSRAAAAAAGMAAALIWPFVYFTGSVLPQTWELFLVSIGLYALGRDRAPSLKVAFLAGCAMGMATSLRPQLIVAVGALALAIRYAWEDGSWRASLAFIAPALLISFSWSLYLALQGTPLTLMQPGNGLNLYLGNHAGASGTAAFYPGLEYSVLHYRSGSAGYMGPGEDTYFHAAMLEWLRSDPAGAFRLWLRKAGLVLARCELPAGEPQPWAADGTFPILRRLDFGVLLALGLPGLALGAWRGSRPALAQSAFLLAGLAALTIPCVAARYRIPLLPALALGIGHLAAGGRKLWAERRRQAMSALSAAAVALFAASSWADALSDLQPARNLGIALSLARGDDPSAAAKILREAEGLLAVSVAEHPRDWDAVWFLGLIRLRLNDWPGAEQAIQTLARARGMDYPYLWSMLAWLRALTDDLAGARDAASAAYQADPRSLDGCLRANLYARLADPGYDIRSNLCRCPLAPDGRYRSSPEVERFAWTLRNAPVRGDLRTGLPMMEEVFWRPFELRYPGEELRRTFTRQRWPIMQLDCRAVRPPVTSPAFGGIGTPPARPGRPP